MGKNAKEMHESRVAENYDISFEWLQIEFQFNEILFPFFG